MMKTILSTDEKAKLLNILPEIKFVKEEDVEQYKCNCCSSVAIPPYLTTCKHTFCRKCFGKFANNACPVRDCSKLIIKEVSQDLIFEQGFLNLQVHCMFQSYGCNEIITLSQILEHKETCRFSTRNLLPRVWTPLTQEEANESSTFLSKTLKIDPAQQEQLEKIIQKNISLEMEQLKIYIDEKVNKVREEMMNIAEKTRSSIQEIEKKLKED